MNATILRTPEERLRVLQDFRNKSDADKAQAIDGHLAIITGLIGLDAVHGDQTEIHPVHMFAVQIDPMRNTADDAWAIFVRNWGNEGFCSHKQHFLELQTIFLSLPRPPNLSPTAHAVIIPEKTRFKSQGFPSNFPNRQVIVYSLNRPDVLVEFHLPPWKENAGIIVGELHLRWDARPGLVQAPLLESEPVTRASEALEGLRQHAGLAIEAQEGEEEGGEEIMNKILEKMTDEQRVDYQALMDDLLPPPDQGITEDLEVVVGDAPPPGPPNGMPTVSSAPSIRQMLHQDSAIQAACLAAPDVVNTPPPKERWLHLND